ncbi:MULTISPECIES: Brp/Blh family beta-carotene 15,15'-dioxygenase [Sphingomonas]|uniref:Brp/Blh family beta-carotene 15,15'-dioxygenase n=1 Tax=Sphingomonas TaxID=13687 RepID=UPI0020BEFBCA|nr:Brp/Blh family beta-carotene 15,15'-dioxygenase [Sphingomonas faeni]MCK8455889.1 Brp/Blh family beta-carotene 15,15'-dioxygenase [Sphingomonas faeni]
MTIAATSLHPRRVHIGRGDAVPAAFWIAGAYLVTAFAAGLPLDGPVATMVATVVFLAGGMPHGAYDIALLTRSTRLRGSGLGLAILAYIGVASAMAVLWLIVPIAALVLFLAVAAIHFGEDWTMLDEPLLKIAAGTAILAAPAIGHPVTVAQLFVSMAGSPSGELIARAMIAVAPVALLVTIVGIGAAWREGAREWAAATASAIMVLIVVPPVMSFALFFVFLHSPRHLTAARVLLADMPRTRWLATGAVMSALAIGGWLIFASQTDGLPADTTAQAFQLLAAVALPHLLLSRWLERRLEQRVDRPPVSPQVT